MLKDNGNDKENLQLIPDKYCVTFTGRKNEKILT